MALVPIAPPILMLQRIGARVTERERVALVIVVRLVEGQRVVDLELEIGIEYALQADSEAVVARLGARFDGGERRDTVRRSAARVREPGAPGTAEYRVAEYRVIAVDEAGEMIGPGM